MYSHPLPPPPPQAPHMSAMQVPNYTHSYPAAAQIQQSYAQRLPQSHYQPQHHANHYSSAVDLTPVNMMPPVSGYSVSHIMAPQMSLNGNINHHVSPPIAASVPSFPSCSETLSSASYAIALSSSSNEAAESLPKVTENAQTKTVSDDLEQSELSEVRTEPKATEKSVLIPDKTELRKSVDELKTIAELRKSVDELKTFTELTPMRQASVSAPVASAPAVVSSPSTSSHVTEPEKTPAITGKCQSVEVELPLRKPEAPIPESSESSMEIKASEPRTEQPEQVLVENQKPCVPEPQTEEVQTTSQDATESKVMPSKQPEESKVITTSNDVNENPAELKILNSESLMSEAAEIDSPSLKMQEIDESTVVEAAMKAELAKPAAAKDVMEALIKDAERQLAAGNILGAAKRNGARVFLIEWADGSHQVCVSLSS